VVPAYLLLLSCGVVAVRQRAHALAITCLILVLVSNVYVVSLQEHTPIKSDFRSVAEHLKEDGRGDLMMFLIPQGRAVFVYYYGPSFRWADAPYTNGGMASEDVARAIEQATAEHEEIWLVVSEEELWDSRGLVRDWFQGHGDILDQRSFARVDVYLYSLQPPDGSSHTEV